jgi:hypothetical protein
VSEAEKKELKERLTALLQQRAEIDSLRKLLEQWREEEEMQKEVENEEEMEDDAESAYYDDYEYEDDDENGGRGSGRGRSKRPLTRRSERGRERGAEDVLRRTYEEIAHLARSITDREAFSNSNTDSGTKSDRRVAAKDGSAISGSSRRGSGGGGGGGGGGVGVYEEKADYAGAGNRHSQAPIPAPVPVTLSLASARGGSKDALAGLSPETLQLMVTRPPTATSQLSPRTKTQTNESAFSEIEGLETQQRVASTAGVGALTQLGHLETGTVPVATGEVKMATSSDSPAANASTGKSTHQVFLDADADAGSTTSTATSTLIATVASTATSARANPPTDPSTAMPIATVTAFLNLPSATRAGTDAGTGINKVIGASRSPRWHTRELL